MVWRQGLEQTASYSNEKRVILEWGAKCEKEGIMDYLQKFVNVLVCDTTLERSQRSSVTKETSQGDGKTSQAHFFIFLLKQMV